MSGGGAAGSGAGASGAGAGAASGGATYTVRGGAADETFAVTGVSLPGTLRIEGGGGSNTLDYSGYDLAQASASGVVVNLRQGTATALAGIAKDNRQLYKGYLIKEQLREALRVKGSHGKALLAGMISWAGRSRIQELAKLAKTLRRRGNIAQPGFNVAKLRLCDGRVWIDAQGVLQGCTLRIQVSSPVQGDGEFVCQPGILRLRVAGLAVERSRFVGVAVCKRLAGVCGLYLCHLDVLRGLVTFFIDLEFGFRLLRLSQVAKIHC